MSKLELSIATVDYDRVRPLIDGPVAIDGVAPVFMTLDPEEIFFRAFRGAEFDTAELSLSTYAVRTARGDLPVFPSRSFRHSGIYIRTDHGIQAPADLRVAGSGWPNISSRPTSGYAPSSMTISG